MNESTTPAIPGWYPLAHEAQGGSQVGYWDGAAWTGEQRRVGLGGRGPRDMPGRVALILLCSGLVGLLAYLVAPGLFYSVYQDSYFAPPAWLVYPVGIVILAAPPVAMIASIAGLVRARQLKFTVPLSLITLILSTLGTVLFVLPLILLFTGVWVIRF